MIPCTYHASCTVRRSVRRLAARLALLAGLLGASLSAQAIVGAATFAGFTPAAAGAAGGTYSGTAAISTLDSIVAATSSSSLEAVVAATPSGSLGAVVEATVSAQGRTMAGEALVTAASTAGRTVATACFASGPAFAACAGVATAAWFALSRIHAANDSSWVIDEDEYGACYATRHFSGSDPLFPCAGSISSAASTWTNTANAAGYLDENQPSYTNECSFSVVSLPSSISVGSNGYATVAKTCNYTVVLTGKVTTATSNIQLQITRLADQLTTMTRPATSQDFMAHVVTNPVTPGVLNDNKSAIPVPVASPVIVPFASPVGDPYPEDATKPETSTWLQDRLAVQSKPDTASPVDADVTAETVEADNPNTAAVEGVDATDPETDTTAAEQSDLCEEHPDISACQLLGTAPDDAVPTRSVDVSFSAEDVGLPSGCPSPISMGKYGVLTYDSACRAAESARPFVIALGILGALLLVAATVRRG